jgi:hypothetical protein
MFKKIFLLCCSLLATGIFAQRTNNTENKLTSKDLKLKSSVEKTTGEAYNPFNEFVSTADVINKFTGTGTYSIPLQNLKTSGVLSYQLELKYSSNVNAMARTSNEAAPTGWVGLGWSMGGGSIECDHNGTMTDADDDYSFITGENVSTSILYKEGKYFLKYKPYWKVEKIKEGYYIKGWRLTDESGTRYTYGDCNDPNLTGNSCNWNTLCWVTTRFVGNGFAGEPVKYPYKWNLSEISDPQGNWIRFKYSQYNGDVSFDDGTGTTIGKWVPVIKNYTKESYLQEIYTNSGDVVQFTTAPKDREEYFIPYEGIPNCKETRQPVYETRYLKEILVKNLFSGVAYIKKYDFEYQTLRYEYKLQNSTTITSNKRLLSRIKSENSKSGITETVCGYYTNQYSTPSVNFGALKNVKNFIGGVTEWEYEQKYLFEWNNNRRHFLSEKKFPLPIGTVADPTIFNRVQVKIGQTSDGDDFYTVYAPWPTVDKMNHKCHVVKWTYSGWKEDVIDFGEDIVYVENSLDYFVVMNKGKTKLWVYFWNGEQWVQEFNKSTTDIGLGSTNFLRIYPNKNVFYTGNADGSIMCFRHDKGNGTWTYQAYPGNFYTCPNYESRNMYWPKLDYDLQEEPNKDIPMLWGESFYYGDNYITLGGYGVDTWNGEEWLGRKLIGQACCGYGGSHDAFVTESNREYRAFKYNGLSWISNVKGIGNTINETFFNGFYLGFFTFALNSFKMAGTASSDSRQWVFNWSGNFWEYNYFWSGPSDNCIQGVWVKNDCLIESSENIEDYCKDRLLIHKWDHKNWCWGKNDGSQPIGSNVDYTGWGWKDVWPGTTFQAVSTTTSDAFGKMRFSLWNGCYWQTDNLVGGIDWDETGFNTNLFEYDYAIYCGNNSFARKCIFSDDKYRVIFRRRNQNGFNNGTYSYLLTKTTKYSGTDTKKISTKYEYDLLTSNYDVNNGIPLHKKVTEKIDGVGTGKTVDYFENTNVRKMGVLLKEEKYNEAGTLIEKKDYNQIVYPTDPSEEPTWPINLFQVRTDKITDVLQNVTSVEEIVSFNNENGLPQITRKTNSDGKQKLTQTYFAFKDNAYKTDMKNSNMLSQSCEEIVYEKDSGDITIDPLPAEIRSAQATTWSKTLGCNVLVPNKSFDWKAKLNYDDGTPDKVFYDFNHAADVANPNWQLAETSDKYNSNGTIIQSISALDLYSTSKFADHNTLKIADIQNAKFDECAILTCDYDDALTRTDAAGKFDVENGWAKGGPTGTPSVIALSNNKPHFGLNNIHVQNSFGPIKNLQIDRTKEYVFSAWVCPVNGQNFVRFAVELHNAEPGVGTMVGSADLTKNDLVQNQWQLVTKKILVSEMPATTTWARIWIGKGDGGVDPACDFYVDDIRFAPAKSFVTTTYYDPFWRKPILSVDANNNPEALTEYDNLGFIEKVQKIDKLKTRGETNAEVLLTEQAYNLKGINNGNLLLSNDFNDAADMKFYHMIYSPNGGIGNSGCCYSSFSSNDNTYQLNSNPLFEENDCTISIFVKYDAGKKINYRTYIYYPGMGTGKINTIEYTGTGQWEKILVTLDIDLLLQSPIVYLMFDCTDSSPGTLYVDDLNVYNGRNY